MEKTYQIPEANVFSFETKIEKLTRRAAKLGVAPISITKTGEVFKKQGDEKKLVKYIEFTVTGEDPIIAGWKFLGSLDIIDGVGTIVRNAPNAVIPSELHAITESRCDHCHKRIRRVSHHVVQEVTTGEIKVVGSSCLKDFIGHSVDSTLSYCEYLIQIDEAAEEYSHSSREASYIDMVNYLSFVALRIRNDGWTSRKTVQESLVPRGMATADSAICQMFSKKNEEFPTSSDIERAEASLEWARSLVNATSDYEVNLHVLAKSDYVPEKAIGLAASMVSAYMRSIGEAVYKTYEKVDSKHIGVVGEKIDLEATVEDAMDYEGDYGTTCRYKLRDASGNLLVWWSSKCVYIMHHGLVEAGNIVKIKGTIKKLDEYKGTKMTVLTRCKIKEIKRNSETTSEWMLNK